MNGDGEWMYRCSTCDEYKTRDGFHADKSKPPFNVAYVCKQCRKTQTVTPTKLSDWEVQKVDDFLIHIGLDPSEGNVPEQFIQFVKIKYNADIS